MSKTCYYIKLIYLRLFFFVFFIPKSPKNLFIALLPVPVTVLPTLFIPEVTPLVTFPVVDETLDNILLLLVFLDLDLVLLGISLYIILTKKVKIKN